jgi:hypothetical protein
MADSDERTPLQPQLSTAKTEPKAPKSTISGKPVKAQKGCLLQYLTVFSSIVIVCAIGIGFLQVVSMYYLAMDMSAARAGVHMYMIFFSAVIVMVELELSALVRNSIVSYSWIGRGFFYLFIGLLVLDQHVGHHLESQLVKLCCNILGNTLAISGLLYLIMGLLCLKRARDER